MSPHELIRHNNQDLDSLILRRPPRVVTPIIAIDAASINRDQILSLFLDNYFPAFHSGSPHGVELWHSLFEGFFMLPKKTHMLDTAITAISCVYLGKIKNDGRVFGYGLQLYNRAIQDMSSMICQNIHTDDIIYTSVIFQEIEVIIRSKRKPPRRELCADLPSGLPYRTATVHRAFRHGWPT